jgi:phosphopentomutase
VPLIVWHQGMKNAIDLGTRATFADVAATVSETFGLPQRFGAVSFLDRLEG